MESFGNVLYVGGNFDQIAPEPRTDNNNGVAGVAQPYLYAVDATTGTYLPQFAPQSYGDWSSPSTRRAGGRLHDRDEDAEHEHGDEHRRHRGERRHGVLGERAHRLVEEEADPHVEYAAGGLVADDARRRASSITRRRMRSTIALSWVATITVVPVRLMR